MRGLIFYLQAVILAACLVINGCGGEDWAYQTDRELKPGPGVFSGKDGEFTIIGSPKSKQNSEEGESEKQTP
ncbi:MAG: hypothetical protein KJO32_00070 [Deltaproteobacteria bacterium]|nr:hypothetical protein [Deltaproteobacteria bacterium]